VNGKKISQEEISLAIRGLTVAYGEQVALSNVSLTLQPGEVVALIGPNGAGKSTLINAVSGILPIRSGKVLYGDQELLHLTNAQRARILGVVPQARQLGGAFTVAQTVMLGRTAYMGWLGRETESDRGAVQLALEQTNLEDFKERNIASLSGGEHQRVLLARALAQSTPVMLLDEPTNHLDMQHQADLLALVRKLTREKQLAVVMALHDLNLVSFFADRIALLVGGKLEVVGTPQEVITQERISGAYQTPVEIIYHPETGAPIIFPQGIVPQN
jgi:iron complex transport system ATP-binding protein